MGTSDDVELHEPQLSYEYEEDALTIRVTVRRARRFLGEERPRHRRPWEMGVSITATVPLTDGTADFAEANATAQDHLRSLYSAVTKLIKERGYLSDS